MIKRSVTYTDWDGKVKTRDLYFHISKTDVLENFDIRDRIVEVEQSFLNEGSPDRDLTTQEIKMIYRVVRELIKLSYGQRSADLTSFIKNDVIWDQFVSSPAYDALVFGLLENPAEFGEFLKALVPRTDLDSPDVAPRHAKADVDVEAIVREMSPEERARLLDI